MRTQRNMSQMKEQNKTPEKELKEADITSLSDAEFKTLVIRLLKKLTDHGNKIKKSQDEMKVILRNKEKSTGKQQWKGGNQDSNKQLGT